MGKSYTRKLTKSGNHSYYVLIPPEWVRDLNWRERQKVVVERIGKQIRIRDWDVSNGKGQ